MSRSGRYSEFAPRPRDTYSPPTDRSSRYDRRSNDSEPRSRRRDDYPRRSLPPREESHYDPRDKYYLPGEQYKDIGFQPAPSRSLDLPYRSAPPPRASSEDRYRPSDYRPSDYRDSDYRDSDRRDPDRRSSSTSSQRPPLSRNSRSGAGVRGRDLDRERHYPPSSSRTQDRRAPKRPGTSRARSSRGISGGKSEKGGGGGGSKNNGMLSSAMRVALEAGAVAALKQRNDPSPWIGMKGTKVAAAAIRAAAIDTFMERKAPKRKGGISHAVMKQATTLALGNLVLGPAAKGTVMGRTTR